MNSRVSVEAEEGGGGGGKEEEEEDAKDPQPGPSTHQDGGNVVLVLPPKDNVNPTPTDDDIPVMMNGVPVYISHTSSGSPLYIRQYPPTLEEMMMGSPDDLIANFDGFSDASAQTFEGFSEASCSSVLFEGFAEDMQDAKFSIIDSLGRLISEEYSNPTDDEDSLIDDMYDLDCMEDVKPKKKPTSRAGRKYTSKSVKSKESPGHSKRSSSSGSPAMKKVRHDGGAAKSRKSSQFTPPTALSASKRRKSTDKPQDSLVVGKRPRKAVSPDDPDYIGEHCNEIGCTVSFLERMARKDVTVSNGVVLELCNFATKILWDKEYVVRWIQRMSGCKTDEPLDDDDVRSVTTVVKRRKALATIHSGNVFLNAKLKAYDALEFILPSKAKKRDKDNSSLQSGEVKKEIESPTTMTKQPEGVLDADVDDDIEVKDERITPEIEREEMAKRNLKRTEDKEKENKEKEKGSDKEQDQEKQKSKDKKDTEALKEEEKRKENETPRSTRTRRMSALISKEEGEKNKEVRREETPVKEASKTERRIGTRRSSMMVTKEEKEKQMQGNEEKRQSERKDSRRASVVKPKEDDKSKEQTQPSDRQTDKKKPQVSNKEQKTQDKQSHEAKEITNQRKDQKTGSDEREKQATKDEEPKTGTRTSNRRASMLLAKEEKEKPPAEASQTPRRIKRDISGDGRRGSATGGTKPEDKVDVPNKKLAKEVKESRRRTVSEGEKDPENCGTEAERRVVTRRSSVLVEPKAKQSTELDASKGDPEERKKSERISTRRDREGKTQDKSKDVGVEGTARERKSSLTKKQEEEQVADKKMVNKSSEKEVKNIGKQTKEAVVEVERMTKKDRITRRLSVCVSKHEADAVAAKDAKRTKENKEASKTRPKQDEDQKQQKVQDTTKNNDTDARQAQDTSNSAIRNKNLSRTTLTVELKKIDAVEEELKKTNKKLKLEGQDAEQDRVKDKRRSTDKPSQSSSVDEQNKDARDEKVLDECESEKDGKSPGKNKDREEGDSAENKKTSPRKRNEGKHERDESIIEEEEKDEGSPKDVNDADGITHKRSKVIHRDKRISRWQNRKMNIHDDKASTKKEELEAEAKTTERKQLSSEEMMSHTEESQSDDSDEDNLVIDEGDSSMPSDDDKSNTSMQVDTTTMSLRKIRKSVSGASEGMTKRPVTEANGENADVTAPCHSPQKLDESEKNQDSESKDTSPHALTSPVSADAKPESSYAGTLGVSKSGRLRKASAKGIQSIEIKCLFMQRDNETQRPPPPLPDLKNEQMDEDWIREKRSPMKQERKDRETVQEVRSPVKYDQFRGGEQATAQKKLPWEPKEKEPKGKELKEHGKIKIRRRDASKCPARYSRADTEHIRYSYSNGHLVPFFKDTNYYLGDYCCKAGISVHDLNDIGEKKVKMTVGMIKELYNFYRLQGATKTSLAIRLFKMNGQKMLDNTHLLSTVIRMTSVNNIHPTDDEKLSKEFILPVRLTFNKEEDKASTGKEREPSTKVLQSSTKKDSPSPSKTRNLTKKRGVKPEDSGDEDPLYEEEVLYEEEGEGEDDPCGEILLTRGDEGCITRGDIVHLYTKWLKDKMSLGSNTFVMDLLHSVEELMAERSVAPIRIPAGTLMSSSVRLHDEYKQILKLSKEDAVMYLQEDWLEDIRYLLSISAPSRRNTTEEPALGVNMEADNDKHVKDRAPRHHSGGSKDEGQRRSGGPRDEETTRQSTEEEKTRHRSGGGKEEDTAKRRSGSMRQEESPKRRSGGLKEEIQKRRSGGLREDETPRYHGGAREEEGPRLRWNEDETPRRRSGGVRDERKDNDGDYEDEALTPCRRVLKQVSRSHRMESVGKRRANKRSIRESLEEYERDILQELEKAGMLDEDEEGILSQLDQEEETTDDEEEEEMEVETKGKDNRKLEEDGRGIHKETRLTQDKARQPLTSSTGMVEVQKILDHQEFHDKKGKHFRYLVRWVGFGAEDDSWVNESNLYCPKIIQEFWRRRKRHERPESTRDKSQPSVEEVKYRKSMDAPKETDAPGPQTSPKGTKKDEQSSIIQAMVKYDSPQQQENDGNKSPVVTKRELLGLYDAWRQENQDELIAGGSNTVNVSSFKGRVKDLMSSRNVEYHPESLLNACFMMTLMKTRLQSKTAVDRFLDSSCLEVLASSHKQYLKRKYSKVEVTPVRKPTKEQKHTVLNLQNELQSLKLDLRTAQKWRTVKSSQLGAVEEEVNHLETAMDFPEMKKARKVSYFKQELQKLKKDVKTLENERQEGNGVEIPLFGDIDGKSENFKMNSKVVRAKLSNMNLSRSTVATIMDIVSHKVSGKLIQE